MIMLAKIVLGCSGVVKEMSLTPDDFFNIEINLGNQICQRSDVTAVSEVKTQREAAIPKSATDLNQI